MQLANAKRTDRKTRRFGGHSMGKQVMGEHQSTASGSHRPQSEGKPSAAIVPRPESPVLIRITSGTGVGELIGIDLDRFTIGSNPQCEVCFPELHGSPTGGQGAKVRREAEGWLIHPHGSQRIYINNELARDATALHAGDTIRFSHHGPEIQFLVQHQNQRPLHQIAEDYAPHLLRNPAKTVLRVVSDSETDASSDRLPAWKQADPKEPTERLSYSNQAYSNRITPQRRISPAEFLIEHGRTVFIALAIVSMALITLTAILLGDRRSKVTDSPPPAVESTDGTPQSNNASLPSSASSGSEATQKNASADTATEPKPKPTVESAVEDDDSPFAD